MAKTEGAEAEPGRATEKSSGLLGFIISMLVLTVVGGVAGGLFGMYGFGKSDDTVTKKSEKPEHSKQPTLSDGLNLRPLSPIITNLASPRGTWIRLEAAIVTDGSLGKDEAVIAGKIAEDVVAFLRTVPLAHIEGANGFHHLREDLNDRARVRSGGKVRELVIQSLIVE
jgi:flagellar FliL protein